MIIVVGLGRKKGDLTEAGKRAIKSADALFVRTLKSEAGRAVKKFAPQSMDDLYERAENFDTLFLSIAERILKASRDLETGGQEKKIVYCVDGDGFSDSSVLVLREKAAAIEIIAGVSDTTPAYPSMSVQTYSAADLPERPFWADTSFPLIITGISDRFIAGEAKLWLLRFYGGEEEIYFAAKNGIIKLPLADLDRQKKYEHNSYAFIPEQKDFEKARYGYPDLMRIMTRLIAPDGCPWDRAHTHESISKNATEEAAELVEAIKLGDIDNMEEESGDVILQGIFHGFIGEKYGEFTADDVVNRLCQKLVGRHTHIFGGDKAASPEEALGFWKAAKRKEKEKKI